MKIIYENVYKKSLSVGLDSIQILLHVGSGYTKGGNCYVRFLIKYCTHHVLKLGLRVLLLSCTIDLAHHCRRKRRLIRGYAQMTLFNYEG